VLLVALDTLLQRIVPDHVRGRVMAVRDMLANVGLVGVAVPLALDPNVDAYIIVILRIVSGAIVAVGLFLVWYYYKDSQLRVPQAVIRRAASAFISVVHGFERGNATRIPVAGPVIFVSNHTSGLDPVILAVSSKRRFVRFMMAKEWYEKKSLNWFYKLLDVIPVNRTGNDIASIRNATRALEAGGVIGMFPEGGISDDGRLIEAKQGVALLALMSKATVCPAYIVGTPTYKSMFGDFFRRSKITAYFAPPLRFDDIVEKHGDRAWKSEEARAEVTKRIMDAILKLRDRYETNPERRVSSAEWMAAHPGAAKPEPS
jgi:1-acyl-sn-glycerol-3-phosphate acyltransferase